jgi:hypothetical protein
MRDSHMVFSNIFRILSRLDDENYGVVKILLTDPANTFEFVNGRSWDASCYDWSSVWADQWHKVHGTKAIPVSTSADQFVIGRLETKGYKPVPVPQCVIEILSSAGVESAEDVLGVGFEIDICDIPDWEHEIFLDAVALCNKAGFEIDPDNFQFFANNDKILGKAVDGVRYLNRSLFHRPIEDLVSTIIHENDHCESQYEDGDERFRHLADHHIGRLVVQVGNGGNQDA